ncbi:TPM domain-containing protein [Qipengyuania sediminis]|uniref:TPM domain-containing protein n=1 Tax=Qipengyuania sediminis TaxID=1532023 RepID=UPI001059FAF6|nr:TPM domain-containing protein [Qipengyuania sediminis]
MRRLAAFLALLLALVSSAAWAQLPARPAGPVADYANILPDTDEALLDAKLRQWTQSSGRPIVVATVPSLGGEEIEPYAVRLFETWGIGNADTDQGVLLLVAPNERRVRIEVGYGLGEYVTDILSGRIIREQITPRFKANDYPGGINAGVDALIAQLSRAPEDAKAVAQAAERAASQEGERGGFPIGGLFWLLFLFLFFILPMMRGGRRRRRRGRWGNTARDIILWEAGSAIARGAFGGGGGGGGWGGGGGGFGGFGGGISGGGGASGGW